MRRTAFLIVLATVGAAWFLARDAAEITPCPNCGGSGQIADGYCNPPLECERCLGRVP